MSDEPNGLLFCDKCDRSYARDEEHDCRELPPQTSAWKPAWKHAAEADGLLPSADAYRVGPISAERTITLTAAHVATLPTGERVELPAGTVLREGTGAIDHRHLLACARGVVDFATHEPIDGPLMRALLSTLRAACGDSIEDVALRAGPPAAAAQAAKAAGARRHWVTSEGYTQLPPEMCKKLGLDKAGGHVWFLPDEQGPAWKAWKEEDLGAVFGERGSDLTERVGLPREMAPSVEPDPWLRGLTITTANAIRSGIDRGLPAKAGVAAVIAAFQAGVDMAIPPKP